MYYQNSAAQHAAAAAAAAATVTDDAQSNPLLAFASQSQHLDPTGQFFWNRAGGNTWQDWSAAIAHSPGRYSTTPMMALGAAAAGHRDPVTTMADGSSAPHDMAAQWPLVMFDQHAPAHGHHVQHHPAQSHPHSHA